MDSINLRGGRLAMMVDQHVGDRIRQRRTLLGFTQEQLAEALDISYQQVQKYETGANRVSAGRLYQIAERLEVEVSYFFQGLKTGSDKDALGANGSSRTVIELVRNFTDIDDPTVRSSIAQLVKSLAKDGGAPNAASAHSASHSNGANGANGHQKNGK